MGEYKDRMNQIERLSITIDNKRRKKLRMFIMVCVSSAFCMVYFLWGNLYYDSGDDYALNMISAGAYDPQLCEYLIWSNILYGKILKILYKLFPQINVYLITMILLNLLSIVSICYSVIEGCIGRIRLYRQEKIHNSLWMDISLSIIISIIINLCLAEDSFIQLQFTKSAGLYTAAGCALLISWIRSGYSFKNFEYVFAIILLQFGFLVRKDSFLAVIAVVCCGIGTLGLLELLKIRRACFELHKRAGNIFDIVVRFFVNCRSQIIVYFIIVVSLFSAEFINTRAYSTEIWLEYDRYNHARSTILDFYCPPYGENQAFYSKLGIDESDLRLLCQWCYADSDKFTIEVMEEIAKLSSIQHSNSFRFDKDLIVPTLKNIKKGMLHISVSVGFILLIVLCICKRRYDLLLVYAALGLGVFCEYYYYTLIGRVLWRIEYLSWLGAEITMLAILSWTDGWEEKVFYSPLVAITSLFICLLLMVNSFGSLYQNFKYNKGGEFFPNSRTNDELYLEMERNDKNYYLVSALLAGGFVPRVDNFYENLYSNITFTGGWTIPSPLWTKNYKEHGIENPILSLVNNSGNYYLVDDTGLQDLLRGYIEKETGRCIAVEQVDIINEFPVWKFEYQ